MKKWITLVLILFLTLINVKAYVHDGIPYTHDGENHLARFANYKIAVREGQIPPRFAPNLFNHYGYPVFNYNYPLANILSVPFSFARMPYIVTFKLLMVAAVVFGLLGILVLGKYWKRNESEVWLALAVYGLSPYLASTILFRGNIGEVLAYALLPWLFLLIEKARKKLQSIEVVGFVLLLTAFLLSHNVTVLIGIPVLLFFAVCRYGKKVEFWRRLGLVFLWSVALSLWFWLPAMAEKSLVILDSANLSVGFADHFPTLSQLLFSPLMFGFSYPGRVDSLSFSVGLASLVAWVVSGLLVVKFIINKSYSQIVRVGGSIVVMGLGLILLQLSLSEPLWNALPLLRFVQLPWRFTLMWSVTMGVLTLYMAHLWPRWVNVLIAVLLAVSAVTIWRTNPIDYRYLTNVDLDAFSQSTTTLNENLPKGFTFTDIANWQPTAEILVGTGDVHVEYWKGSDRQYAVVASEPVIVVEPTMVFAGWETIVTDQSGSQKRVNYLTDEVIQGRLAYELEPGSYQVRSRFSQWTWPRLVGNTVSVLALVALGSWLGKTYYDQIRNR